MKENWLKPGQLVLVLSAARWRGSTGGGVVAVPLHQRQEAPWAQQPLLLPFSLPVAEHCGPFGLCGAALRSPARGGAPGSGSPLVPLVLWEGAGAAPWL